MNPRAKIAHYYGRLKVAPDAPPEVIRAAYKALAQKYHPDRHQGSVRHELVLAALNKAQEVLLDPERRAAHDAWIRREELRLGLREREPADEAAPGFLARAGLMWWTWRGDGLPLGEAARMHLGIGERVGLVLLASLLALGLAGGALALLFHLGADEGAERLQRLAAPVAAMSAAPLSR